MAHVPHELADEFPRDHDLLHRLKLSSQHFAALVERYHDVNRAIHRNAAEIEPRGDEAMEQLKRHRLSLIDEIGAMMVAARQGAA